MRIIRLSAITVICLLHPRGATAYEINDNLDVFGHSQIWLTLYEQMEETGGLYQQPSRDEAATSVSGLSINRARLGLRVRLLDGLFRLFTQFKLERDPGFLDLALSVHFTRWLSVWLGQFKIPGPHENLTFTPRLDFIQRTHLARRLADYSLARTTYASSLFHGVRSNLRDLGLALKGTFELEHVDLGYFLMMGNGLGANLFIGGGTDKQYIIANDGQFFYGARLEVARILDVASVGGHVTYNRHDDIVFNSGRVVYDLDRLSYSADLQISIPGTGVRLAGMFGGGVIDDDFDDDGNTDLRYHGGEARVIWRLDPLLRYLLDDALPEGHHFELGFRYDNFTSQWNDDGVDVEQHTWTVGINYAYEQYLRVQLNLILRDLDDPDQPDLDDDVLLLAVQAYI